MSRDLYFPSDEFVGFGNDVDPGEQCPPTFDFDIAADYLELQAVLSRDGQSLSTDITDILEVASEEDASDVTTGIEAPEKHIASAAVKRMASRKDALGPSYPFTLDGSGTVVTLAAIDEITIGQAAYLVSLILSNLSTMSPILDGSVLHPTDQEVGTLRQHFQYFATAAMAGEICGPAWSFGFPRPDGSGFVDKLTEIWSVIKDGTVKAAPSSPSSAKDDGVDIFAWRQQNDKLPGSLIVAAQVATGKKWKKKSLLGYANGAFKVRWFDDAPASTMLVYHVIPFARPDQCFRDDVVVLGNVLHRLRVPRRVMEASTLVENGVMVEAFDKSKVAADWLRTYVREKRAA